MAWAFLQRKPLIRRWSSRLTLELFLIVIVKITALGLLWWFAFAPYPKPAHGHDAIEQLLSPNNSIPSIHETTP